MSLKLTWFGHSAFGLEADGKQVLIDPFFTGNPVCVDKADDQKPVAILVTHAHNDHVGDAVSISERTGAPVITTFELANLLEGKGATAIGGNHGGTIAFDGGSAKITPAWHTSTYEEPDGTLSAPGVPAGFVVRFGGKTVYFAGDTCLFGDMALIGEEELDVAVLPIGDHFTMGPKDAVRAAKLLNATQVVPCHFNTFPPIQQDPASFKQELEAATDSTGIVLQPGESVELD